jgi:hypothetical protein
MPTRTGGPYLELRAETTPEEMEALGRGPDPGSSLLRMARSDVGRRNLKLEERGVEDTSGITIVRPGDRDPQV